MPAEGFTSRIRNLLRSPASRRKDRRESLSSKVTLEKVLGITASGKCGLACDPRSGLVAYPAGCVVVLLNPKKNRQSHILTSRKSITALSFSPDGKYLVTGESGHLPAVRVWDVAERSQVAELQTHKYGVSCVAFSPSGKHIVSVGNQHDMIVSVWAWKKDVVVAANKVSSKVTSVSFSEDSSYFVTVGNRHVKFWYLDQSKASKASAPVPLLGRAGLLGELRNNFFCDVACGRGSTSGSTFCITSSGLLCELNSKRILDKWVDLQTGAAHSLSLSDGSVFCGCADGAVHVFKAAELQFVCTLPRPHSLGWDAAAVTKTSHLFSAKMGARYPDAIAVTFDPASQRLSCVYNDHSLYVWDVRDVHRVGKLHSALCHASCVWDLEMFPELPDKVGSRLSSGSFLSCSADNTIRLWNVDEWTQSHNVPSADLQNIIYINGSPAALLDPESPANLNPDKAADGQMAETRTGIRTICVSPDGQHLASGDRNGLLRIHSLSSLEEILKVDAHDAEILCLEYSKAETGLKLLATASRDRLIHVLDAGSGYSLVQTLDEHSSSITAVRFAACENDVRMISCGADKSIYFRTAHKTDRGTEFRRSHHLVRKTTLYDMGVDPTCKYAAVGCQDRCIRIFNINSGKQKKLYKGSLSEDGSLIRVQLDPSGQYVATSCSDKNISIFEFSTGECVATMFGHSEIVTGMKFTNDCKYLISASGDSCIFVWRLAAELTIRMRERLRQLRHNPDSPPGTASVFRHQLSAPPLLSGLSSDSEHEREDEDGPESEDCLNEEDTAAHASSDSSQGEEDTGGSDEGQDCELAKHGVVSHVTPDPSKRPRRRWSRRIGSLEVMVKSMLDLRQLETFSHKKNGSSHDKDRQSVSTELGNKAKRHQPRLSLHSCKGIRNPDGAVWDSEEKKDDAGLRDSRDSGQVEEGQGCRLQWRDTRRDSQESCSPDSACYVSEDSRGSSPDWTLDDSRDADSISLDSTDEAGARQGLQGAVTSMDEALMKVTGAAEHAQEDFLTQNFATLNQSCSAAEQKVMRPSMSSRFLARGQNNRSLNPPAKSQVKHPDSHSALPPLSKGRPSVGTSAQERTPVWSGRGEGPRFDNLQPDCDFTLRSLRKKKTSGSHLWRLSSPSSKPVLDLDRSTCLQKSQSAINLSSDAPYSPAPSSDSLLPLEPPKRPQQLFLERDASRPQCSYSSSSSGSPQSPQATLPWDVPRQKSQHSYMNHTASSLAKSSRSTSVGEGLQTRTPPDSPNSNKKRKSSEELERRSSQLSSSSLSTSPALTSSHPLSPSRFCSNAPPPSRIPLLKQPLSPSRSLCLEGSSRSSLSGASGDEVSLTPGTSARVRHLSLSLDHSFPSSRPVRQKRSSVSESLKEPAGAAAATEEPLLGEQAAADRPQSDLSVTVETCRQVVNELSNSLRKTLQVYSKVLQQPSPDQSEMRSILWEALLTARAELDSLPEPLPQRLEPQVSAGGAEGEKTLALLEQYAELLLKSVERKLDTKT